MRFFQNNNSDSESFDDNGKIISGSPVDLEIKAQIQDARDCYNCAVENGLTSCSYGEWLGMTETGESEFDKLSELEKEILRR